MPTLPLIIVNPASAGGATGGDFRRTLKIPTRTADAARLLREGKTRTIDAGRVTFANGGAGEESRFFLNVASFGMGGEVIRRVKGRGGLPAGASRLLGGKLSFALAAPPSAGALQKTSARGSPGGGGGARPAGTHLFAAEARHLCRGGEDAPQAPRR